MNFNLSARNENEIFFLNGKIASFLGKETPERDILRTFIWIVEMFMKFDFSVDVWALIWGKFNGKTKISAE